MIADKGWIVVLTTHRRAFVAEGPFATRGEADARRAPLLEWFKRVRESAHQNKIPDDVLCISTDVIELVDVG